MTRQPQTVITASLSLLPPWSSVSMSGAAGGPAGGAAGGGGWRGDPRGAVQGVLGGGRRVGEAHAVQGRAGPAEGSSCGVRPLTARRVTPACSQTPAVTRPPGGAPQPDVGGAGTDTQTGHDCPGHRGFMLTDPRGGGSPAGHRGQCQGGWGAWGMQGGSGLRFLRGKQVREPWGWPVWMVSAGPGSPLVSARPG